VHTNLSYVWTAQHIKLSYNSKILITILKTLILISYIYQNSSK